MAYNPLTGRYTPDPAPVMTPFGQATSAAKPEPAAPTTRVAANEARKAAGPPSEAPAGYTWKWIGTDYKLYKDSTPSAPAAPTTPAAPSSGSTTTATQNLVAQQQQAAIDAANMQARQSAYDLLMQQFSQYGLGSLVEPLKELVTQNVSPSEFAIRLQSTDAYKKRFSANQDRIASGLRALSPAEYIGLEDQYQNIMRNYGMPASYWTKDALGKQSGFDKFIANDVSATELENRLMTAQERVLKSNPEVLQTLKQFYPDITNGDILAYSLDPKNALKDIQRKVSAAEIGGAALAAGLNAGVTTAEELAGYGVSKAQAQQGFQTVAELAPRGTQLAEFYSQQPYGQQEAISEVFGTSGATEAAKKRKKLSAIEQAAFAGASGIARGALDRDRSNNYGNAIQSGAGYF